MTWPSVEDQDAAIRRDFPEFRLIAGVEWMGVWEGPVRPISKTYCLRIVFFRRRLFEGWSLENSYVSVFVVEPVIGAEAIKEERLLPHVYWNEQRPEYPYLCLYDPEEMTWTPELLIAATIIPWALQWLFFYEYWQITGEFKGPGRHPERRRNRCQTPEDDLDPETRVRREQFRNAEFHRLGRKLGGFASSLSMAAAFEEFSQPRSSQDLNSNTLAETLSARTSTLSQVLQRAVFWPLG